MVKFTEASASVRLILATAMAWVTLQAVSLLQFNGILMMWKIQQLVQDDAMRTARIHPTVHPGNRELKCSYGKISGRLYRDLGNRAGPPYIKIKIELILVYPRST